MIRVFFDEHGGDAEFVLRRVPERAGRYTIEKPFRFRDPLLPDRTYLVPAPGAAFETDLASVPSIATWLVPKDGTHTPAALLHDAMIGEPAYVGDPVTRQQADDLFRDVMRYLDVPLLRRWMMWAAVSMATLMDRKATKQHVYWRVFVPVVVGALLVTGLVSVLDLVDIHRVRVPLLGWHVDTSLPWMGERSAGGEILGGLAAAVLLAVVTPLLWGRRWRVGAVAGLAVIPFAFPLVLATLAYAGYTLTELAAYRVLGGRTRAAMPTLVRRFAEAQAPAPGESPGEQPGDVPPATAPA